MSAIREFLANYSDERLVALLAHAESGRLAFKSCCCFIGCATANHALKGHALNDIKIEDAGHLYQAREMPFGRLAEDEFHGLGIDDRERREAIIPIIREEIARREAMRRPQENPENPLEEPAEEPIEVCVAA